MQIGEGPRRRWGHLIGTNEYPRREYRRPRATEEAGMDGEKSERSVVPKKPGNPPRGDLVEGRENREGRREHRTAGGNDGRSVNAENHLNETSADSEIGEADARESDALALSPRGPRVAFGGVSAPPEGRSGRHRRSDGRRVRRETGGEPPVAPGSSEVRYVPGSAGPTGPHPERQRV